VVTKKKRIQLVVVKIGNFIKMDLDRSIYKDIQHISKHFGGNGI
jgi:hypothetical protein